MSERQGLIQVNTGNGKGKTTAALGTVLRAAGHGRRACVIFFLKGNYDYGEYRALKLLPNVAVAGFGLRRLTADKQDPAERAEAAAAMEKAREAVNGGQYDIVLLDEINVATAYGLVKVEDVLELAKHKPAHVELILTGRYADDRLLEMADQVTEMVKIKHPYDKGVKARPGIDY